MRFKCEYGKDGYYIIDRKKIQDYNENEENETDPYRIEKTLKGHEAVKILNELYKSKEYWKTECLETKGENSMLHHEINKIKEKGYELSYGYKAYMQRKKQGKLD